MCCKKWKEEEATGEKLDIPDIPEQVSVLFQRIWSEAWTSAHDQHDLERRSFMESKQAFSELEQEMKQEIAHLEEQNRQQLKDLDSLQEVQIDLVKVRASANALKLELSQFHEERSRSNDKLAEWVERCTKAETELQQLKQKRSKST
ncbi:MAG: hypothetical protein HC810_01600 [Acaryochloridaceae cyanobacterium RL_2_7]|nr:hypothetical protein [Acaryochloridaceae cyanobacterium RL_2_7]